MQIKNDRIKAIKLKITQKACQYMNFKLIVIFVANNVRVQMINATQKRETFFEIGERIQFTKDIIFLCITAFAHLEEHTEHTTCWMIAVISACEFVKIILINQKDLWKGPDS